MNLLLIKGLLFSGLWKHAQNQIFLHGMAPFHICSSLIWINRQGIFHKRASLAHGNYVLVTSSVFLASLNLSVPQRKKYIYIYMLANPNSRK